MTVEPFLVDLPSSWGELSDFVLDEDRTARLHAGELEAVLDEIAARWSPMGAAGWASVGEALEDENFHALAAAARARASALGWPAGRVGARPPLDPAPRPSVRALLAKDHAHVSVRVTNFGIVASVSSALAVGHAWWSGALHGATGWVGVASGGVAGVAACWLAFARTPTPWLVALGAAAVETAALSAAGQWLEVGGAAFAVACLLGVAPILVAALRDR